MRVFKIAGLDYLIRNIYASPAPTRKGPKWLFQHMSKAPAMPMYWDAYLADTTHLTTEEHGAYMLLLAAMWRRNGSVPDDDKDNARILGLTPAKWRKIKARLTATISGFNADGDTITQEKLRKTWEITQEKISKNAENGAKGGRAAARKNNGLAEANATKTLQRKPSIPEPEPEPYKEVTSVTSNGDLPSKHQGFDDFWEVVPNKLAKQAARSAWGKLSIENKRAAYSAAKAGWFSDWQARYPDANPLHPASYLNGRRWEDQPDQTKLKAITGGQNEQPTNKSKRRVDAFIAGARGAY